MSSSVSTKAIQIPLTSQLNASNLQKNSTPNAWHADAEQQNLAMSAVATCGCTAVFLPAVRGALSGLGVKGILPLLKNLNIFQRNTPY